jgi:hypothetical protein
MGLRSGRKVVDRVKVGIYTYQNEKICCGKERCKRCAQGVFHGPYWYKYWNEQRESPEGSGIFKLVRRQVYIGKTLKIGSDGEGNGKKL